MAQEEQGIHSQIIQFDYETRRTRNCIKFDIKSGLAHRMAVIDRCIELIKDGDSFFTRARHYKTGLVADLYWIPMNCIYEFQDTESDESIQRKEKIWKSHGFNFEVVKICRT